MLTSPSEILVVPDALRRADGTTVIRNGNINALLKQKLIDTVLLIEGMGGQIYEE